MLTSNQQHYKYNVGGCLGVRAPSYIYRIADNELYQCLKQGEFCYVFNCRQTGKSSLRVRAMQRLIGDNIQCISIDFSTICSSDISINSWYRGIIDALHYYPAYSLQDTFNLDKWLKKNEKLPPNLKLKKYIEEIILNYFNENIVILIDEIDSVLELDFSSDSFFSIIRSFYNQRVENQNYNRISFALFGVTTPSFLVKSKKQTPFNIGKSIALDGLEYVSSSILINGFKDYINYPEYILSEIFRWTNGQPFLTQKLCEYVQKIARQSPLSFQKKEDVAIWVDQLVQTQIIDNWKAQDDPIHLSTIEARLLNNEKQVGRILGIYQAILQKGYLPFDGSNEQTELQLSGLVFVRAGKLTVLNPIYQAIFNLNWVNSELEKQRPYSESILAWHASQRRDDSRLLRGKALRDAQAWVKGKNLSQLDYDFLVASTNIDRREAQQSFDLEQSKKSGQIAMLQRILIIVLSSGLLISIASTVIAMRQSWKAQINELKTIITFSESLFASKSYPESLQEAIKAGQKLEDMGTKKVDLSLKKQIKAQIQHLLYSIKPHSNLPSSSPVWAVAFSPDGSLVISAQDDGNLNVKQRDGTLLRELDGHQTKIYSVALSPDGSLIASGSADTTIKLWDLHTGTLQHVLGEHSQWINSVAFNSDGTILASGGGDTTINLWNPRTGELISTINAHESVINNVAFSPDGKKLVSASHDQTIKVWDVASNMLLQSIKAHNSIIDTVSFSPDGQIIASASRDKTIKLWNAETGELIHTIHGHQAEVSTIAFNPTGQLIASGSWDAIINVWNLEGALLAQFDTHDDRILDITFSPDGQTIASASQDKTIKLWSWNASRVSNLNEHDTSVFDVTFSPNGKHLATASGDNTVKLWEFTPLSSKPILKQTLHHQEAVYAVTYSPDSKIIATAPSYEKAIKLWNMDESEQFLPSFKSHKNRVRDVAFSNDGHIIASAGYDHIVHLWNREGKLLTTLKGHQGRIYGVDISVNNIIATASDDKTVKLWSTDGTLITTLRGHHNKVRQVAFSPDGQLIASTSLDQTIKLWSLDGKLLKTMNGHKNAVWGVAFSPDGDVIASGGWDNTVKLWSLDGTLLTTLQGHTASVYGVTFHPDGNILASASEDGTVRTWDIEYILDLNALPINAMIAESCGIARGYFQDVALCPKD